MRVLGIADSDSYLKWGASLLDRMPADWERSLVILRTPALPSMQQQESALSRTTFRERAVPVVDLRELAALVRRERPDAVLLSVRGPVVRVLVRTIAAAVDERPAIVSGLPGISIPETLNALYYRSQVDLLVLHSKREIRAFASLAAVLGIQQDFGLATLPFLGEVRPRPGGGDDIVFAAQAKVPRSLEDRQRVVAWLVETAREHPDRQVVVKLRGVAGEPQTHGEAHPYDTLLGSLADLPPNLVVSTGPMSTHLESAGALVTVSSTAALEAIAARVRILALDDFGVTDQLINVVFEGSGLLGDSRDLVAGDFRTPLDDWRDDNYFHDPADETWVRGIEAAVERTESGPRPLRPQFRGSLGGNLRRIWDRKRALGEYDRSAAGYLALAVGVPLRGVVRQVRRVRARARRIRDTRGRTAEVAATR